MAGTGEGYDFSVTTYSPDGRIFQIDYAQKAIDKSQTVLAICCKDGIVMAGQKIRISKMLVHGTNKRAYAINKTSGCVVCGMVTEGRNVVNRARSEASSYKQNYGEVIPGYLLAERIGLYLHQFTLYASYRPMGCSVLIGSYDKKEGCSLFCVEPSGLVQKWYGKALGKGRQLANTEIEKLDLKSLTCEEALFHVSKILLKGNEENKETEIEINWICEKSGWEHAVVPKDKVDAAQERAKKAIDEEEDN